MNGGSKHCCTCKQWRPLDDFNIRRAAHDGRQSRCRECSRAWYAANRERHIRNVRRNRVRQMRLHRRLLGDYLSRHPCADCGEPDIRVLEFDHDDPAAKRANVGYLARSASWKQISAEIARCTVRCANCHRRRTAEQFGWWRNAYQPPPADGEPVR